MKIWWLDTFLQNLGLILFEGFRENEFYGRAEDD